MAQIYGRLFSFPGLDYDQPSPFLHKPVRTEDQGYFESDPLNMPPAATLPDGTLDDPFAGRLTDSSQSSKRDKSFSQRFKGMLAKAIGVDKIIDRKAELRMKLPRRPRHVLSVAVSGLAARDISAHFVQVRIYMVLELSVLFTKVILLAALEPPPTGQGRV
jgi:hypothetical protein